jgi:hypothetical protein
VEGGEARVWAEPSVPPCAAKISWEFARAGFGCAFVVMRSEVDRGIMMVGTEVSASTSGSPSASGVAWAVLVSSKRMMPSD